MPDPLTYAASGVDYDPLDRFKRLCQRAALTTRGELTRHGFRELEGVRGESAYLIETPDAYWAHVEEGLGTKNLIADALLADLGPAGYFAAGVDTVASIINDLITSGASPVSVAMHAAAGDARWFDHPSRGEPLAAGFAHACRLSGAVWGGGETPVLRGMVDPGTVVLAGSALGIIQPKDNLIRGDVQDGDAIVLLASTGVHANGLTLCRALAERLPLGYRTPLSDGTLYGAALVEPGAIYAPFARAYQEAGLRPHYAVHITGHGWRKLMRLCEPFVYRLTALPAESPLFRFLREQAGLSLADAYGTFNMGAGYAVYVPAAEAQRYVMLAASAGLTAWVGGRVEKQGDRKAVELEPIGVTFAAETLQVRE